MKKILVLLFAALLLVTTSASAAPLITEAFFESNDTIVSNETIILSDEEYQKLMNDLDNGVFNTNKDSISVLNNLPEKARVDWGGLISRSTYTHSTGSTKQYQNSGNGSAARTEFNNIGSGDVTSYVSGNNITHVKSTPSGHVTLYTSSSTTGGAVRPTLSFLNDKVRFMGD